jgi:hypothetical protein
MKKCISLYFLASTLLLLLISSCEQNESISDNSLKINDKALIARSAGDLEQILDSYSIPEYAQDTFFQTLEYDDYGRIAGFHYSPIRTYLNDDEVYVSLLTDILGETVKIDFVDSFDYDGEESVALGVGGPIISPTIFHDKRNWRRPGCKAKTGAICIIYI